MTNVWTTSWKGTIMSGYDTWALAAKETVNVQKQGREEEETKRRQLSLISSMPANLQRWELRRFQSATALQQYCVSKRPTCWKSRVCVCVCLYALTTKRFLQNQFNVIQCLWWQYKGSICVFRTVIIQSFLGKKNWTWVSDHHKWWWC